MDLDEIIAYKLKTATYVIELDVFSGRPNPIIDVDEGKEHLMKKFADHRTFQSTGLASTPGYRGFIVHKRTSPKEATLEIIILTVGKGKNSELERSLLHMFPKPSPGPGPVCGHVYTHVVESIDAGSQRSADRKVKMGRGDPTDLYQLPDYHPDSWNINAVARLKNSSYNYATNTRTDTFAKPGRCNGVHEWSTAQHVLEGCHADGLKERKDGEQPSKKENTGAIALAVWPHDVGGLNNPIHDFMFYRQDADTMWSYKPGPKSVINIDDTGNKISDPSKADRGPFTYFVGYLGTNPNISIC